MTTEDYPYGAGIYEPGDKLISQDNDALIAVRAATDGSSCFVCDDGIHHCYYVDGAHGKCPKCHSDMWGFIDFMGERVIFVKLTDLCDEKPIADTCEDNDGLDYDQLI